MVWRWNCVVGVGRRRRAWEREARDQRICQGIGVDEPKNNWAFDTSQFDNILKRLKVQAAEIKDEAVEKDDVQDVDTDATTETNTIVKSTWPQGRNKTGMKMKHLRESCTLKMMLQSRYLQDKVVTRNGSCQDQNLVLTRFALQLKAYFPFATVLAKVFMRAYASQN
ncbi:hypothetical protein HYC85_026910 [Camellia sinensis]|uniref:Uncharacterized protein n=1 Tax=Camellia sinensis TaxID=4442 RepID=A0A7J7G769_CAMSI|nr:hypothetical protein HYC85_026910 [Camellia sinensis]